jgi:hypothetical protein
MTAALVPSGVASPTDWDVLAAGLVETAGQRIPRSTAMTLSPPGKCNPLRCFIRFFYPLAGQEKMVKMGENHNSIFVGIAKKTFAAICTGLCQKKENIMISPNQH